MFYFAWLALPGTRLPQLAGWPRRSSDQAARDGGEAGASQAWDSAGTGRKVDLVTVAAASREASHHRDETEMAFPGRTRLRSPPLEPAGERARPTLALSKGHRAEMELWRNKKALDLRGHRTTPHRSGERRGYRSETESPCDQEPVAVNQRPATVRERLAPRPKREFSPSGEMCPSLADKSASRKA